MLVAEGGRHVFKLGSSVFCDARGEWVYWI